MRPFSPAPHPARPRFANANVCSPDARQWRPGAAVIGGLIGALRPDGDERRSGSVRQVRHYRSKSRQARHLRPRAPAIIGDRRVVDRLALLTVVTADDFESLKAMPRAATGPRDVIADGAHPAKARRHAARLIGPCRRREGKSGEGENAHAPHVNLPPRQPGSSGMFVRYFKRVVPTERPHWLR